MAPVRPTRRRFFGLLLGLAALIPLGRYLQPRVAERRRLLEVPRRELPANGALVYREAKVAVLREGERLYALSLVCTHLGCTVTVTPTELVCPCHGSRFDRQGRVLTGPADRSLARLVVSERGEILMVTTG
jgi:Rieske Fe-S protein